MLMKNTMEKKKRLFCEINPTTYYISLQKEKLKRHLKNLIGNEHYAKELVTDQKLPVIISEHGADMIKRGPGIDPVLQANKADNIRLACSKINGIVIKPGETFSYRKIADGKDVDEQFFYEGKVDPGDARAWDISEGTAKAGDVITVKMLGRGGFSFRFIKK